MACVAGDFAGNLSSFKTQIETAADDYKNAVQNLEAFLMNYGKQWEFGNDFFS